MFTATTQNGTATVEDDGWKELHRQLKALRLEQKQLHADESDLLLEADDSCLHKRLGYVSIYEYMERELDYDRHSANERLRVARELLSLPRLRDDYRSGALCFSAVRELTRVVTPQTEEAFRDAARGKTSAEVQRLVSGRTRGDTPETPPDPKRIKRRVVLELDGEDYEMWQRMRAALADEHGDHLEDAELAKTIIRRVLEPAVPAGRTTPPAVMHCVTTCRDCKKSWTSGSAEQRPLSASQVARALCDCVHIGDLETDARTRPTSEIPNALRRKVFARDGFKCAVPGCRSRRCLDVHHRIPRAFGGQHTMGGLVVLCFGHHQALHDGKVEIVGTAPDFVARWRRDADLEIYDDVDDVDLMETVPGGPATRDPVSSA